MTGDIPAEAAARFWSRVDKGGADECWLWTGCGTSAGYGRIRLSGRGVTATHVSLALDGRARQGRQFALHSCDNPPCVNPRHLRWGTHRDNADDMLRRGRANSPRGEQHGSAKLTEDQVRYIRTCGKSLPELSAELGLAKGPLCEARSGKTWGHVA